MSAGSVRIRCLHGARHPGLAVALMLLATAIGCSGGAGGVRPAPGVRVLPAEEAGSPDGVALLSDEPGRGFVVVGRVYGIGDARFEGRIAEARSAAERTLRLHAASVGAQAVIVDDEDIAEIPGGAVGIGAIGADDVNLQRPGGSVYATRPVHRVTVRGRAIVFAD
ncbi:MAG: hypothetical protein AAGA55_06025 [Planctomycetota bacterium]